RDPTSLNESFEIFPAASPTVNLFYSFNRRFAFQRRFALDLRPMDAYSHTSSYDRLAPLPQHRENHHKHPFKKNLSRRTCRIPSAPHRIPSAQTQRLCPFGRGWCPRTSPHRRGRSRSEPAARPASRCPADAQELHRRRRLDLPRRLSPSQRLRPAPTPPSSLA